MSRYPNLVANGSGDLFGARGNGFRHRRFFTVAGNVAHQFPAKMPTDHRGLFPVKVVVIGGGSGGSDANDASAVNGSGTGAGYAHKTFWIKPGVPASITVGAAGQPSNLSPGNRAGGETSITIGAVIVKATGGGNAVGGVGSGGDVNTKGGDRLTTPSNVAKLCGASAGAPWGDGIPGIIAPEGGAPGRVWRMPKFWDLDDFVSGVLFEDFIGIGGGAHSIGSTPATFGGGGYGGFTNSGPGGGGLAILYW